MAQSRSHKAQNRDFQREYKNYQSRPEQIHNRSLRNQARREYEKTHGNLPTTTDVDHRTPLIKGGSNAPSNTRALGRSLNRSFRRTRTAGMK